ncbi:hypothetical protein K402DRAFT_393482 [Aulographum hederae CBS 113979]|uniref:Uncharacterized protein n=1 Tax=Aulographum hederae CBS 113979 TaxID=1176131 RepID=A0A6G1H0V0_9PEZI|nr:hypothetical protein K402DRAFT_393482 [Aulographum hederae CBS 113979]
MYSDLDHQFFLRQPEADAFANFANAISNDNKTLPDTCGLGDRETVAMMMTGTTREYFAAAALTRLLWHKCDAREMLRHLTLLNQDWSRLQLLEESKKNALLYKDAMDPTRALRTINATIADTFASVAGNQACSQTLSVLIPLRVAETVFGVFSFLIPYSLHAQALSEMVQVAYEGIIASFSMYTTPGDWNVMWKSPPDTPVMMLGVKALHPTGSAPNIQTFPQAKFWISPRLTRAVHREPGSPPTQEIVVEGVVCI